MQVPLLALIAGFLAGPLVNLTADYLSARRHHDLARTNPFVSPQAVPPKPAFLPHREPGKRWPIVLWSGTAAAIARAPVFAPHTRLRHVLTEIAMTLGFVWISEEYASNSHLPFLLFYAAVFALVVIIDLEHRWVLFDTIWPPALVAIAEAAFVPGRIGLIDCLRGGLYGFGILLGLYILGLLFAKAVGLLTGRRVGRTVLGFGDVRLGTLSGLILGWGALGPALLLMILSGAIAALVFIVYKVIKTRRYRIFSAIPYGPYVVFGTAIMLYAPWIMGDVMALILQRRYGM
ncbi:MAG TPA: hypothetical protein VMT34_10545 [Aggregatilineales bacterium]|nr:hypothetical protein [Aggregatilineales bacterium]